MTKLLARWTDFAIASGGRLLGILVAAVLLNRLLRLLTNRLVRLASSETLLARMREKQTRTVAGILYSAGTAVIVAAAVLTALPEFGVNVAAVAVLGGLASLALGFGAQHLVRDLINGFFIVFEDQYVVGDTVRVGDTLGRVEHLTLRRTVIRDVQGALVTLPNGTISQVSNLSRDWSQLFLDVTVSTSESADRALEALVKITNEFRADPAWSGALVDGPRVLGIESLAPSGVTIRVQIRSTPNRQHDVARELRRRIKTRFDELQISWSAAYQVELVGGSLVSGAREETDSKSEPVVAQEKSRTGG